MGTSWLLAQWGTVGTGRLARSRARHWKCRRPARASWVRIPPRPPVCLALPSPNRGGPGPDTAVGAAYDTGAHAASRSSSSNGPAVSRWHVALGRDAMATRTIDADSDISAPSLKAFVARHRRWHRRAHRDPLHRRRVHAAVCLLHRRLQRIPFLLGVQPRLLGRPLLRPRTHRDR